MTASMLPARVPRAGTSPSPAPTRGAGLAKVTRASHILVVDTDEDLAREVSSALASRASGPADLRVLSPGAGGSGARVPAAWNHTPDSSHSPQSTEAQANGVAPMSSNRTARTYGSNGSANLPAGRVPRGYGSPAPVQPSPTARGAQAVSLAAGAPAAYPPLIETCESVGEAIEILANEANYDVVLAGPSTGTPSGLEALRIMHESAPQVALVLAFDKEGHLPTPSVVRTGAIDLVYVPGLPGELTRAMERAMELGKAARREVSINQTGVTPAAPLGTVITLASATGGCGKTFLASNLAAFFASHGRRTCILDLDLQFGEVSTALQLRPEFTIADVLSLPIDDPAELASHFEEYLVRHETGTWVLSAPRDPSEADRIAPSEVGRVIEVAQQCFDIVIVDTPAALTEVVLAAFDRSDLLYAVTTLDTPSIRNLGLFVHTLERLKIPSENVRLVLNKAERDVGIEVEQVARLFTQEFSAVLPYAREVSRSINLGKPVIASDPGAEISRLLVQAFAQLLGPDERAQVEIPSPASRRRRNWPKWLR
ncbi:MAG: AAA family ATPase [Acidimicrobiales bacterium]